MKRSAISFFGPAGDGSAMVRQATGSVLASAGCQMYAPPLWPVLHPRGQFSSLRPVASRSSGRAASNHLDVGVARPGVEAGVVVVRSVDPSVVQHREMPSGMPAPHDEGRVEQVRRRVDVTVAFQGAGWAWQVPGRWQPGSQPLRWAERGN